MINKNLLLASMFLDEELFPEKKEAIIALIGCN